MVERFLPGVPGSRIAHIYDSAPGNEIAAGKFDSPESSAALAANAFGFFLDRVWDLPPLPGCRDETWPACSLALEKELRFPWRGGKHPWLDVIITTPSTLICVESKRFEPFRKKRIDAFSDAFWRPIWGDRMNGYQSVRDKLHELEGDNAIHVSLDATQLVKHALAIRTSVGARKSYEGLSPVLFYLYAEPESWPRTSARVDEQAKAKHREEIKAFARDVAGDEVRFVACTYRELLAEWRKSSSTEICDHAETIVQRFSP